MKILLALFLFAYSFPDFAACEKNVQIIKTGTPAPCDGWIVTPDTMQKFAQTADELELSRKLVLAQDHLRKLDLEEIEHYKTQSKEGQKALSQSKSQQVWIGAGAFLLGVVVTGVAAKAAIEATR